MTALPAPAFDTTLADPDIPPAGRDLTLLRDQLQAVVADRACPMQEAHLYLAKASREVGASDGAAQALASCERLAPKSCIAAECRAVGR